jgi:hypothetical protein
MMESRIIHIFSRDEWLAKADRAMPANAGRSAVLRTTPCCTVVAVPAAAAIASEARS